MILPRHKALASQTIASLQKRASWFLARHIIQLHPFFSSDPPRSHADEKGFSSSFAFSAILDTSDTSMWCKTSKSRSRRAILLLRWARCHRSSTSTASETFCTSGDPLALLSPEPLTSVTSPCLWRLFCRRIRSSSFNEAHSRSISDDVNVFVR